MQDNRNRIKQKAGLEKQKTEKQPDKAASFP
jgi:hypothetical protein